MVNFLKTEAISLFAKISDQPVLECVCVRRFHPSKWSEPEVQRIEFNATIAYNRTLAREWRAQLSYNHNENITTAGTARSNALYTTLVRDVTILP